MYTKVLFLDLNLSSFVKKLGSFRSWVVSVNLVDFVCVKLNDRLRVGHGDAGGVEKGTLFLCLGYIKRFNRCEVNVMTSQLTDRIHAVKESETNNS